jgi:hypothetical protein
MSGSGYLHWSFDPFEKMVIFPPNPLILDMCKVFEHVDMLSACIQYQPYTSIPNLLLAQILGFWVTCGVKMMWLCHGWGQQSPQTASHIHNGHIQSDWAHWYAIHGHTVSALHSYTHPTPWLRFWGSGSLVESKRCDYVMVEADSHLKLLPISILDIYKVFEHIDMLSIGIQ